MKILFTLFITLIPTTVFSGLLEIGLQIEYVLSTQNSTSIQAKNLNAILGPNWLGYIENYGCWCYFDEKHGQGHGMPQDGYDDACLALHHGTACAMLEIDNCDPKREETIAKLFIAQDGDVEYS